ncbi:hypothetical protein F7725_017724 [Dissostichus mawsoni]|uniref:FIIND domain-containing protein n=1 Tax=Dissostichus mawsoni TaxID=36200 RepID=A0A7J5XR11_DISMA|nr:hypothetical protein F7725_017724 [Dissostichus mawsoni]
MSSPMDDMDVDPQEGSGVLVQVSSSVLPLAWCSSWLRRRSFCTGRSLGRRASSNQLASSSRAAVRALLLDGLLSVVHITDEGLSILEPLEVTPTHVVVKSKTFDSSFGPDYPPIFEVFLMTSTERVILKVQDQGGKEVWTRRVPLEVILKWTQPERNPKMTEHEREHERWWTWCEEKELQPAGF